MNDLDGLFITKNTSDKVRAGYYITKKASKNVQRLSNEMGVPMTKVVEKAIDVYVTAYDNQKERMPDVN
tara:strand:+ start:138 stop:344 length:207 start_codon:yes stop_codon:yes gene_type:complete